MAERTTAYRILENQERCGRFKTDLQESYCGEKKWIKELDLNSVQW
jgi:hypothetical protein